MRILDALRARLAARTCRRIGHAPMITGRIWLHGGGAVRFGKGVVLDGSRGPIELHVGEGAELTLEDHVRIHGGTSIEVMEALTIGSSSLIGAWCKLMDNNFHPLAGDRSMVPASSPVSLGSGVHLGERCIVLPGTKIESGARLRPGVVIGRRVPPNVILAGNPPRRVGGP